MGCCAPRTKTHWQPLESVPAVTSVRRAEDGVIVGAGDRAQSAGFGRGTTLEPSALGFLDDARRPAAPAVVERVLRRLEAALVTLPGRDCCYASDPEGSGVEGAQAHPASNPYRALGEGGR